MATSEQSHDDMWVTPVPVRAREEEESAEAPAPPRVTDEHAVEDTWYQVLRRKHVEDADED